MAWVSWRPVKRRWLSGAVHSDMRGDVGGERLHQGFKVFLAAHVTDIFRGEVGVHAGAIPVALDRLAVQLHIDFVFLAQAHHQVASGPQIVSGLSGTLCEDLELPLAFRDFRVDAFMVDAGRETGLQVFFHDFTRQAAYVFIVVTAVVWALGSGRVAIFREAEGASTLIEKIFLLETKP